MSQWRICRKVIYVDGLRRFKIGLIEKESRDRFRDRRWKTRRMQFNIFLSRIFQSREPLARESTAHDSGKWMPRRISVFSCSKDEGVSHSASRDYETCTSVASYRGALSGIFQFLILSTCEKSNHGCRSSRESCAYTQDSKPSLDNALYL